jgi:hypothetical protein
MTTGSNPAPLHGAMARSAVLSLRVDAANIPDSVIAAAREERSLRRLQRRVRRWSRVGWIR